ncbi:hypothetical protein C1Y63_10770 [Corynebacterium sp. 13CS0277]|uniref:hypothetical protein n=1 Tax=Corynebacterium sp. 13CS0277 TaxID=2071994 RepID=UPI000D0349AB|nr:hypothetical protein [Corynebacterium sp. 13CS0277]PRQ10585.1 hypothetical protein C1Y63_10770 [Corynebacterium sp. 13CS0277]
MFFRLMLSEWTKLRSTKSFWWISAIMVGLCALINALTVIGTVQLAGDTGNFKLSALDAVNAVSSVGFIVLIIGMLMSVTSEYRHDLALSTFLATPRRVWVLVAKAVNYAIIGAILTEITLFVSIVTMKLCAGDYADSVTIAGDDAVQRILWVLPLLAALLAPFCVGVGALIRQTAGASSLMILWFAVMENLVMFIPKIGVKVAQWLPFMNFTAFMNGRPYNTHFESATAGLWIFVVWSAALFVLGCVVVRTRDV